MSNMNEEIQSEGVSTLGSLKVFRNATSGRVLVKRKKG